MARKSLFTFDRWDFLGTRLLLAAVAVGVAGFGAVAPILQWLRGDALTWQLDTGRNDELRTDQVMAKPGVDLAWPGTADVEIRGADAGTWLATLLPGVLLTAVTIVVVLALLRLLGTIQARRPFAPAAVRSLRIVGAALLGGAVMVSVAGAVADAAVRDAAVEFSSGTTAFEISLGPVVVVAAVGLVCAALAEAFAHGIELADDVEGLV